MINVDITGFNRQRRKEAEEAKRRVDIEPKKTVKTVKPKTATTK